MLLHVEALGHAAVDARLAFFVGRRHAILERQAREFAIELVSPLVIGTDEAARVALWLLAEAHAAMGAAVLDDAHTRIHTAIFRRDPVAHHDHLPLADPREAVI